MFNLFNKINTNVKVNKYLDVIDIIYWINLDRSKDRRNNMLNILKDINIPAERISAVDGKNITDEELYSNYSYETLTRTRIEYSCLLSHLKTIQTFAKSEKQIALILEDDLSLEYVHLWDKKISEIIKEAPEDWDIIQLNYVTYAKLTEDYSLNDKGHYSCCGSYLINKKGANKLLDLIYKDNKFVLLPNRIHTADNYIYPLVKTYTYKYPYFTYPNENTSTIHDNHISYHVLTKKLAYESWIEKNNGKDGKVRKVGNFRMYVMFIKNAKLIFGIIIFLILFLLLKSKKK